MLNETTKGYFYNKQSKFSTLTFEIVFTQALEDADIEARNLVAKTIIEGTAAYPTKLGMRRHLASLYAANVGSSVSKDGLLHEITFQFSFVDPIQVNDPSYTYDTIFELMLEILQEPAMEQGLLLDNLIQTEKRLMVDRINRLYDDKTRFAQMRLTEIMFAGTPIAKKAFGEISKYATCGPVEVTRAYESMLHDDGVYIYVVGNIDEQLIVEKLVQPLGADTKMKLTQATNSYQKDGEFVTVIEKQNVQQAKLFMGYKMDGNLALDKYIAAQVAASILGGGLHSKLFMNVREKASLAYTVSAGMDTRAILLFIYAGIDIEKKDQAIAIIEEQLAAVIAGDITDEEMLMSKESLVHGVVSSVDNPFAIISIEKMLARVEETVSFDDWLAAIEAVTVEEVKAVASTWIKDTIYILAPNGKEEEAEVDA